MAPLQVTSKPIFHGCSLAGISLPKVLNAQMHGLGSGACIDLSGYRVAFDEYHREHIVFTIKIRLDRSSWTTVYRRFTQFRNLGEALRVNIP